MNLSFLRQVALGFFLVVAVTVIAVQVLSTEPQGDYQGDTREGGPPPTGGGAATGGDVTLSSQGSAGNSSASSDSFVSSADNSSDGSSAGSSQNSSGQSSVSSSAGGGTSSSAGESSSQSQSSVSSYWLRRCRDLWVGPDGKPPGPFDCQPGRVYDTTKDDWLIDPNPATFNILCCKEGRSSSAHGSGICGDGLLDPPEQCDDRVCRNCIPPPLTCRPNEARVCRTDCRQSPGGICCACLPPPPAGRQYDAQACPNGLACDQCQCVSIGGLRCDQCHDCGLGGTTSWCGEFECLSRGRGTCVWNSSVARCEPNPAVCSSSSSSTVSSGSSQSGSGGSGSSQSSSGGTGGSGGSSQSGGGSSWSLGRGAGVCGFTTCGGICPGNTMPRSWTFTTGNLVGGGVFNACTRAECDGMEGTYTVSLVNETPGIGCSYAVQFGQSMCGPGTNGGLHGWQLSFYTDDPQFSAQYVVDLSFLDRFGQSVFATHVKTPPFLCGQPNMLFPYRTPNAGEGHACLADDVITITPYTCGSSSSSSSGAPQCRGGECLLGGSDFCRQLNGSFCREISTLPCIQCVGQQSSSSASSGFSSFGGVSSFGGASSPGFILPPPASSSQGFTLVVPSSSSQPYVVVPCDDPWDCTTGLCQQGTCTPCRYDEQCGSGICDDLSGSCELPPKPECDSDSDCRSHQCDDITSQCIEPQPCTDPSQCASGLCFQGICTACQYDAQCGSGICEELTGQCTPRSDSQTCTDDQQCASNLCVNDRCAACTQNSQCRSLACDETRGRCQPPCENDLQCDTGRCVAGACLPCSQDGDCTNGMCNEATGQCVPRSGEVFGMIANIPAVRPGDILSVLSGRDTGGDAGGDTGGAAVREPLHPPVGDTGPATLAVMAAGAAAGWAWMKRRRKNP